ncbi:MAG: PilZ domain-containing protein, partial [Limnobacter sp.]|nr:PilZ domain-containing protein [Limnobacter sp.]
ANSDSITLKMEVAGSLRNVKCRRIGSLSDTFSLVGYPELEGELITVKPGQTVEMKFFDGMEFIQSPVEIHRTFFNPEPFIILKHPGRRKELRQTIRGAARVASNLPATVVLAQAKTIQALVADISTSGALLLLQSELPGDLKHLDLRVEFEHNGHVHDIEIKAKVMRHQNTTLEDGAIHTVGVQFVNLSPLADLCVSHYVRGEVCKRIN